ASRLGISVSEARFACERLIRLGLVVVGEDGQWRQGPMNITTTGNPFTAAAFRRLQSQILGQAAQAMEQVPMELRDQSSMTMAIRQSQIEDAKKKIRDFRREFCADLQKDEN